MLKIIGRFGGWVMNSKFTGEYRFVVHKQWFGPDIIKLQLETKWDDGPDDYVGMPTYLSGKGWVDATPNDLLQSVVLENFK
jgi:hypothetical protein